MIVGASADALRSILMNLQIQCPKCSKRFTVQEDLTGKTVECGSCEHRFPVNADSMTTERTKVYTGAGKKNDEFLSRLGRSPSATGSPAAQAGNPRPPSGGSPQVDAIMPASPGQTIAIGTGVSLILLFALLFFLGSNPGGVFQDVDLNRRRLLGGFVALLGAGLIFVGAKNRRGFAFLVSLVLVGGLMALIETRQIHTTPLVVGSFQGGDTDDESEIPNDAPLAENEIIGRVGYGAIERQIEAMGSRFKADGSEYVFGIFVEGLQESDFMMLDRYFKKKLVIPPTEALLNYKRNGERDRLIIITGLKMDFDNLVRHTEKLGAVISYPALRLVELRMSEALLQEPSGDLRTKLTDPTHPSFFSVNLDELSHIDSERVKDALQRLGTLPPEVEKKYQEKIVGELVRLLGEESDLDIHALVGTALRDWAAGNQAAVKKVSRIAEDWIGKGVPVPRSFVEYLTENQSPEAALMVDRLWATDSGKWADLYASIGPVIEPRVQYHLQESPPEIQRAAADLLKRVGTEKSLPILRKYQNSTDDELRILVLQAIEAIGRK